MNLEKVKNFLWSLYFLEIVYPIDQIVYIIRFPIHHWIRNVIFSNESINNRSVKTLKRNIAIEKSQQEMMNMEKCRDDFCWFVNNIPDSMLVELSEMRYK